MRIRENVVHRTNANRKFVILEMKRNFFPSRRFCRERLLLSDAIKRKQPQKRLFHHPARRYLKFFIWFRCFKAFYGKTETKRKQRRQWDQQQGGCRIQTVINEWNILLVHPPQLPNNFRQIDDAFQKLSVGTVNGNNSKVSAPKVGANYSVELCFEDADDLSSIADRSDGVTRLGSFKIFFIGTGISKKGTMVDSKFRNEIAILQPGLCPNEFLARDWTKGPGFYFRRLTRTGTKFWYGPGKIHWFSLLVHFDLELGPGYRTVPLLKSLVRPAKGPLGPGPVLTSTEIFPSNLHPSSTNKTYR